MLPLILFIFLGFLLKSDTYESYSRRMAYFGKQLNNFTYIYSFCILYEQIHFSFHFIKN